MRIINVEQGTPAWIAARRGAITASRIKDVMAVLKNGGESESRAKYKLELIAERISGITTEHYVSPDMLRGTELEPIARAEYEITSGNVVDQVGFAIHPEIPTSGASPDGIIGDDGAIEIKVPRVHNHLRWLIGGIVPPEHQLQCLWVMNCCDRQWLDFISFCPELPDGLRLFVVRMQRDDARIQQIEAEVVKFESEIEAVIADLSQRVKTEPVEQAPEDMSTWAAAFEPLIP
jgi:exodeoxyribonuclease (lambda-induced)